MIMDVQGPAGRRTSPTEWIKLGQRATKIYLLYDYIPQVMLIQHDDPNKSTNIFQNQQSRAEDLTGVL